VTAWAGLKFGGDPREEGGAHAGRVVRITLPDKGLTGEVPAALGALTVGSAHACNRPLSCACLTRHREPLNDKVNRRGFKVRLLTWRAGSAWPDP